MKRWAFLFALTALATSFVFYGRAAECSAPTLQQRSYRVYVTSAPVQNGQTFPQGETITADVWACHPLGGPIDITTDYRVGERTDIHLWRTRDMLTTLQAGRFQRIGLWQQRTQLGGSNRNVIDIYGPGFGHNIAFWFGHA